MAEISQEELDRRVAILHRFRTLLQEQRNKFQEYLNVLEKQKESISEEDPEKILAHTELEQQVVKNIINLQKVIVPISKMYSNGSKLSHTEEDKEIKKIQNDLSELQDKVLKQNEINRDLLRVHIEQIRTQLSNFKNPYKNNRSVYAPHQPSKIATIVQIDL